MKLSDEQRAEMVARLLCGEHAYDIARDYGVDCSLPSLRAYTWGFIDQRLTRVRTKDITPEGKAWMAKRTYAARAAGEEEGEAK